MEATIAELASRQHGIVTRRQLLASGVAPGVVDRRLKAGWLEPVQRGVYRVGPIVAPRWKEMAACLACGPSAVLSERSAATLWQLPTDRPSAVVVVTVRGGIHRRPGIRVRRVSSLGPDEITSLDGIPLTTPARTVYDLATSAGSRELERVAANALARGLTNPRELRRLLARHRGGPGTARLRAILDTGDPVLTRSEAEERFLGLVRKARLEPPQTNVRVGRYEVDFFWPEAGLVVEIDGSAFHSVPGAFDRDRLRDSELIAEGLRVARVTWKQLVNEPEVVLALVVRALAAAPPSGRRRSSPSPGGRRTTGRRSTGRRSPSTGT